MRWKGRRSSRNIEDRRHLQTSRFSGSPGGGILRLLPVVFRFLGVKGTIIAVLCVGSYGLLTGNLGSMLAAVGLKSPASAPSTSAPLQQSEEEKELAEFVSIILADTEQTWGELFRAQGGNYQEPRLVLFRNSVKSACGTAQSAMGPFYCPADRQVYIDLAFYQQLKNQLNAPGDFAQAYVIAHEVGHHIQTLLGISQKVHAERQKQSQTEANKLSVRLELQADCFAGIWAHHADHHRQLLEAGDVEEGLRAASAIGDDTLQKQSRGYVTPDSFTHGSSQQRVFWFKTGMSSGNMLVCDTFKKPQ